MKISELISIITTIAWFVFVLLLVFLVLFNLNLNTLPESNETPPISGHELIGGAGDEESTVVPIKIEVPSGFTGTVTIVTGVIAVLGTFFKSFTTIATARVAFKTEQEKHETEKIRREMQNREIEILKLELEKEKYKKIKERLPKSNMKKKN